MAKQSQSLIPSERIERAIILLRGEKVMLDADLAALYGVPTGRLNRAVVRNEERFPPDFMFELTDEEFRNLKCQVGISSSQWGGRRRSRPRAFTEQGIAMLSSVLRSPRAVRVNMEPPPPPEIKEMGYHTLIARPDRKPKSLRRGSGGPRGEQRP